LKGDHKISSDKAKEEATTVMDFFNLSDLQKSAQIAIREISYIKTSWHQIAFQMCC
jgi:hypothetical protein